MFTKTMWARRILRSKELGQAYNTPYQLMANIKNYAKIPSALPFLEYIPEINLGSLA